MVIVGAKEAQSGKVNLRYNDGTSLGEYSPDDAIKYLTRELAPPYQQFN
ncbi:hypothetical protein [Aestuariirhabdus haliotis]